MVATATEVANVLADVDVTTAFVVGSNHNLRLLDALSAAGIVCVPTRCEVGAVHAADGHARTSRTRTAVVTSTGPGAGNAVGAFATAAKDGSPVVHLTTTHFPGGPLARGVHTTLDQGGWHRAFDAPVLDGAVLEADAIAKELGTCLGAATIIVPDDDAKACALPIPANESHVPRSSLEDGESALAEWMQSDSKLLMIGGGARVVSPERLAFIAERSGAAVITTTQGKDLFSPRHSNFAGCTLQGPAAVDATAGAEFCLALGSRLSELSTAAWSKLPKQVIRVGFSDEVAPLPAGGQLHLPIDVCEVAGYLARSLPSAPTSSFGSTSGAQYRQARFARGQDEREHRLLAAIASTLEPRDVLVCDMTKLAFWAALAMDLPEDVRFLWPGMLNMGFGLPAGIGAAEARPDQHVIVLCGDGGLLSIAPELDTAASTSGRLTIVMIDDNGYGLLRPFASEQVQRELCTFSGPDWRVLAQAFGIKYRDATTGTDLASALSRNEGGALLVRVDGSDLCRANWREA